MRKLARAGAEAELSDVLRDLDSGTALALTRAFSQYFQLANIAEQLHRSRELRRLRPADRRPLRLLMQRLAAADLPAGEVRGRAGAGAAAPGVHRAPDRVVAADGAGGAAPGRRGARPRDADDDAARRPRSTPSGRPTRSGPASPSVADEARGVGWFLERLVERTVPDLVGAYEREARAAGFALPSAGRPVVLGCWVGGDRDGNPNVTPP